MNDLTVIKQDGQLFVDSRELATMAWEKWIIFTATYIDKFYQMEHQLPKT